MSEAAQLEIPAHERKRIMQDDLTAVTKRQKKYPKMSKTLFHRHEKRYIYPTI